MCEPMTMAMVGMSALSALGGMGQANQQAANMNAQAGAFGQQAANARTAAAYDAETLKRDRARAVSRQRAAMAAGGGRVDSGSNRDLQGQMAGEFQKDINMRRYQGDKEAAGHLQQAANLRSQAKQHKRAGQFNALMSFGKGAMGAFG